MGMREKIAWRHVINQKGDLYLMDEAEKTYIVDFSKLNPMASRALHGMQLFHMIGVYALPISLFIVTAPLEPTLLLRLILVIGAVLTVYLIDYLILVLLVIPKNIREILEEKK